MTTTAFDDQFTPSNQTIEPVRHPYSTEAILRRNVADLELALRTQTERATHPGATHCDDCGLTWLDDGLNPLGCPYCKNHASERNARRYLALRESCGVFMFNNGSGCNKSNLDAAADRLMEGGE